MGLCLQSTTLSESSCYPSPQTSPHPSSGWILVFAEVLVAGLAREVAAFNVLGIESVEVITCGNPNNIKLTVELHIDCRT